MIYNREQQKIKAKLKSTSKILTGPSQQSLEVRGSFLARLKAGTKETDQEIYVIKGLKSPYLDDQLLKH